jgi:hypothetical protein
LSGDEAVVLEVSSMGGDEAVVLEVSSTGDGGVAIAVATPGLSTVFVDDVGLLATHPFLSLNRGESENRLGMAVLSQSAALAVWIEPAHCGDDHDGDGGGGESIVVS